MSVSTRLQVDQGSCPSFNFAQLTTPTRHPHKKTCEKEPILVRQEETITTTWHNPLYRFDNFFDTPFDTPRATNNVSLTMNPEERNCHLEDLFAQKEEQAQLDRERIEEDRNIGAREISYPHAKTSSRRHDFENRHAHGDYKKPFMNNPSCGNNGNNTPPRSSRTHIKGCPSPPRPSQSHHESEVDKKVK